MYNYYTDFLYCAVAHIYFKKQKFPYLKVENFCLENGRIPKPNFCEKLRIDGNIAGSKFSFFSQNLVFFLLCTVSNCIIAEINLTLSKHK